MTDSTDSTDSTGSTHSTDSGTQGSEDSVQADAPVTSDTDPTQTQHPAGDSQAQENQETESPA